MRGPHHYCPSSSFDAARRSLDINRRRSQEAARSQRRYDEHWGAAEGTDTRLKCADGVQLCAHSQMLACWSPALRDMLGAFSSSAMVESMHGPTYVFSLDDASEPWVALLNTMYPLTEPQELSWVSCCLCVCVCVCVMLQCRDCFDARPPSPGDDDGDAFTRTYARECARELRS
jgi:hypothetical protein